MSLPTHYCIFVLFFNTATCIANVNLQNALANIITRPLENVLANNSKNFIEMASDNGYLAETHEVVTLDGYILAMHRLPAAENCPDRYPVLIMHGILQSSESWLDSLPQAPGYILSDECYDVWFGNIRGNYNSRRHLTLNPDTDLAFWKFSINEMGIYDLPAMIDSILDKTNSEKLIYIGFSQGGAIPLIMTSERPEYAEKISLSIGLSPATRVLHSKSALLKTVLKTLNAFQSELEAVGVWEVFSKGFIIQESLDILCQVEFLAAVFCGLATAVFDSPHPESLTPEIEKRVYEHFPYGTSVQNLAHYGQLAVSRSFDKFDYGAEENMKVYGSSEPPEYDISSFKVPTVIYHGLGDHLVDEEDIQWLLPKLPNVLEYIQVEDPLWNHFDMPYSRYWKETIFVTMKTYLEKYDST